MRVLIRRFDGLIRDGIILAEIGPVLRVAVPGADDAVEFRGDSGIWVGEDGEPVQIDFGAATDGWDMLAIASKPPLAPGRFAASFKSARPFVN